MGEICFQIARPNSWQTEAMSPPLPVRTRGKSRSGSRNGSRRREEVEEKHTQKHQSCENFSLVLSAPRIIIKC